ncbi:MAG: hypothetical protein V4668_01060 [Patescibacteria group bacterium]
MERQPTVIRPNIVSSEAFLQPPVNNERIEPQAIDPAYPRYEKTTTEILPIIPTKIVPIIPENIVVMDASLQALKKFIDNPVTAEEIPNKEAFMRNVFPWIVNALSNAEYDAAGIDAFLKQSIDTIDFHAPTEKYLNDINRVLQNIWKQVVVEKGATPHEVRPVVHVSEPLLLTKKEQVQDVVSSGPMVEKVDASKVSSATTKAFENTLESLDSEPFNREAYLQFVYEVHTSLRDRYDAVTKSAQQNLKRYSEFYTPSPTEKEALQFLSTLKSQYVRLQSKNSLLGVTRAEVMNSLNKTDAFTKEDEVKTFIHEYLAGTENLFTSIERLEAMIESAKGEEKPALGEAYRTQFESLRVAGEKILTTLPTSHQLYNDFKIVVEKGIGDLITAAAVENNGDKAVLERSSYFIILRDRVKASIAYIQAEQEFENFKQRQLRLVQTLESSLTADTEMLPQEKVVLKKTILENIEKINHALTKAGALPAGASLLSLSQSTLESATKDFATEREQVKLLLGETKEILKELQNDTSLLMTTESPDVEKVSESVPEPTPVVAAILVPLHERSQRYASEISESAVSRDRLRQIRSLFKPARIGMLALVAAAFGSDQYKPTNTNGGALSLSTLMGVSTPAITPELSLDRMAIEEFLKHATQFKEEVQGNVNSLPLVEIPKLTPMPEVTEEVPGVVLPSTVYSVPEPNTPPELKIFGAADTIPLDPEMSFNSPTQSEQGAMYTEKDFHTLQYGDIFWDISEGETLAGTLPVMKQINPYFKQHLIDRLRDRINKSPELRKKIGGFGDTANDLVTGARMNLKVLNEEFTIEAVNAGYLQ